MDFGVGSSMVGNRWIKWWCPRCSYAERRDYDAPTCHACGERMRRIFDADGYTTAWHCPKCGREQRA